LSIKNQITNRRIKRIGPIGKIIGLLTASFVALIGLAMGLEPQIILWRAVIASFLIGSVVAFGVSVIQVANHKRS
jgi:Na+/proline symporter